jgi:hypothetical protein
MVRRSGRPQEKPIIRATSIRALKITRNAGFLSSEAVSLSVSRCGGHFLWHFITNAYYKTDDRSMERNRDLKKGAFSDSSYGWRTQAWWRKARKAIHSADENASQKEKGFLFGDFFA